MSGGAGPIDHLIVPTIINDTSSDLLKEEKDNSKGVCMSAGTMNMRIKQYE
jgi:hypothetical protein